MAFPDYAVVDDFDRADADPIDGNWSLKTRSADNNLEINGNQVAHSTAAGAQGTRLYTTAFVRPFQVWVEIPNASSDVGIDYCIQDPNGASVVDGYRWQTNLGTTVLELYRIRGAGFTKIGGSYAIDVVSGDAIGVHLDYDGAHKLYHRTSGVWSLVDTVTHTEFISGYAGLLIAANASTRLDNFSAVQVPHGLAEFPSAGTVVTDDFNRANEDPIAGDWGTPLVSTNDPLKLDANEVTHSTLAGEAGAAWWTPEQFSPPLEVVARIAADLSNVGVDYCVQDPGTATPSHYRWQTNSGPGSSIGRQMEMYRCDDDVFSQLTDDHGIQSKDGDLLGVRLEGTTHYLFYKPVDGDWQLVDTVVDANYTSGFAGVTVGAEVSTNRIDDFRVAAVEEDDAPTIRVVQSGQRWA